MHKFFSLFAFLAVSLLFIHDAQAQCSLTGPSSIPQGQTRTYTATAQGGANYFWSTTGGLAIVGSNTGRTVTVRGNGNGTICYTRYRAGIRPCCQCRNITIGGGGSCPTSVVASGFAECIRFFAIADLTARLTPANPGTPVSYSWTKISGPGTFLGNTTSANATMRAPSSSSTRVRVTVTCQGGSISDTYTVRVGKCDDFPIPEISPNPASNTLNINLNTKTSSNYTIEIINKKGELVMQKSLQNNGKIDVSKLSEGLYFVRTKEGDKIVKTERLIKK